MKETNNFKQVYETEAPDDLKNSSLRNAQGSVKTVKSIFEVLDLYISKFFGAIIHSFKDNPNHIANAGLAAGLSSMVDEKDESVDEISEEKEDEDIIS